MVGIGQHLLECDRAWSSRRARASASTYQNEQIEKVPSSPSSPSGEAAARVVVLDEGAALGVPPARHDLLEDLVANAHPADDVRGKAALTCDPNGTLHGDPRQLASEWIHQAVLAIRADIPTWVLRDTIAQFPSFSEAFGAALRMLPDAIGATMDHGAHPMIETATVEVG